MMIKTSELEGAALDWAVANAVKPDSMARLTPRNYKWFCIDTAEEHKIWSPSTNWSQGGPLIESHDVSCSRVDKIITKGGNALYWMASCPSGCKGLGPTPLIAACRAIVAAKLGEEVDVPEGVA